MKIDTNQLRILHTLIALIFYIKDHAYFPFRQHKSTRLLHIGTLINETYIKQIFSITNPYSSLIHNIISRIMESPKTENAIQHTC
jgi:hypothetical protein